MTKLIAKTRILCTDDPLMPRHEVRVYDDHVECDCGNVIDEARRLGTLVSLGKHGVLRRSCAGLLAFVTVGLPKLVTARVDATGDWGAWKDAWASYAGNALVREVFSTLVEQRDAAHKETLAVARTALRRCRRYRNGMTAADYMNEVSFVPDTPIEVGASVALFSSDGWTVPLQPGWLESVGKAKPVIDGRFVVGVSMEHPGFVYAIDGTDEDGFTIREFAVVGDKLGKVAA